MIEHLDKALCEIQALLTGRGLYGADHPSVQQHADRAFRAAEQAFAVSDAQEASVVLLDGRLRFGSRTLPSHAALRGVLIPRLERLGDGAIVFRRGLRVDDVLALVRWLDQEPGIPRPAQSAGIALARVSEAPTEGHAPIPLVQRAGAPPLQPGDLLALTRPIAAGGRPDRGALDRVVMEISAMSSAHGRALLPMAQLKAHDEYTFVHSINVAMLSSALAEAVGLSGDALADLTLGALLHDIGKSAVPEAIIGKRGPLSDSEFAVMQRHPIDGARILLDAPGIPDIAPVIAYEHHMCRDGGGYPSPGRPRKPHLASEIVHVADVFDALRTARPYRAAMPTAEALGVLAGMAGKAFAPVLFDTFVERVTGRTPDAATLAAAA